MQKMKAETNPIIRVAFVAILAILAMLFMVSLFNRGHAGTQAGGAYLEPVLMDEAGVSDYPTSVEIEQQQQRLSEIIAEENPSQKAQMAKEMSRFG